MRKPTLLLALTGVLLAPAAQAENKVSLQTLQYAESDDRIMVRLFDLAIEHDFGTDYSAKLDVGYDAISGASPLWQADPHYLNEYVEGKTKVADESRRSAAASLTARDARRNEYTVGASWSREPDYVSKDVSAQAMLWEDELHNRAYIFGASFMHNTAITTPYTQNREDKTSRSINLQAGINQVLNPHSTVEASVYAQREQGYLSNHYLNVVRQDSGGQHYLAADDRPALRQGGGGAVRWIQSLRSDVAGQLWYRYYQDDWGIRGHTLEAKGYWDITERWRLNPVVRWYQQSAANFYRGYRDAVNSFAGDGFASTDARLGRFIGKTVQLNVEYQASKDWSFNAGASSYRQDNGFAARWLTAGLAYQY